MKNILSADIGGTKTLLQLCQVTTASVKTIKQEQFESAAYSSFDDVLNAFVPANMQFESACFAVAGPISENNKQTIAQVTNLPWQLNKTELEKQFHIKYCSLINDFQANGYSIAALDNNDCICIQAGEPQESGLRAIIGAGTGLGQALLVHDGRQYQVYATEGGHTDLAANSEIEIELYRYLAKHWPHVSYERVVSGMGIENLFHFFCQHDAKYANDKDAIVTYQSEKNIDLAAAISAMANTQSNALATEIMHLFIKFYGAQAGNLALSCLPYGGLYIAGGIAMKNRELMQSKIFLDAFHAKGRMQNLMEKIPITLITNANLGLLGARQVAISNLK